MFLLVLLLSNFLALIYLITASPFTLWLDAPRFVAAITTLSVGNPPEPLYMLLAHPFTYLPIDSPIFKIQLFSAFSAALTLVVVYATVLRLIDLTFVGTVLRSKLGQKKRIVSAIFAFFSLAFSYQFWSQAQNVENFILVTLLEVTILLILLYATSKWSVFFGLLGIAFIFGLATGTNPVIASVVPAILIMMAKRQKYVTPQAFTIWFVVGTIAVVAIHLYMPIRAVTSPFLNYWDATTFERVWKLSTGEGLNVYQPQLGRINGFTGSPEVFFQSSFNFIKMSVLNFHVLLIFVLAGAWYLWQRNKYYFLLLTSVIAANFIFSGFYYSGNQESWFLMSFLVYALLAGVGFYWFTTGGFEMLLKMARLDDIQGVRKYQNYTIYFLILAILPLIVLFPFLNRREWVLTADYIENLYRPIGEEKAILFGSSDLFDSVSYYVHDVPGTPHYRPNTVPVTDNIFYIFDWYRNNLSKTTGIKVPDGTKLKYNSALEYSRFVNDFFEMNIDTHKVYVTIPAMRNNFLAVYEDSNKVVVEATKQLENPPLGSLIIDEKRFKLVPRGLLYEVVRLDSDSKVDIAHFEYQFQSPGFPKKQPLLFERVYRTELTGMLNEYAYSLIGLGDQMLNSGDVTNVLNIYQNALEFNEKNAEVSSRLGNYYGVTGNHNKATEYFEKALKLEPNNTRLLLNLALAYENTGKTDKAITRLNQVLRLTKPNSQENNMAKTRLEVLRSATPSAGTASPSADFANLPLQLPPGAKLYKNEKLNLQFGYPEKFELSEEGDIVHLTNKLTGKDELTFDITTRETGEGEELEKLAENLPFSVDGIALGTQPMTLPGFEAVGKTYGSGEHLTFLILMRRASLGFIVKVYPGDSTQNEDFSLVIGSMRSVK